MAMFKQYEGPKGVQEFARQLGIETCLEFSAEKVVPKESVRALCRENKCGKFQNNYMCPPHVGSLEEIRIKLGKFSMGLLFQYSESLNVKHDRAGVIRTKVEFHKKILQIEEYLKDIGVNQVWGMIGGDCGLCKICKAVFNEPCLFPDKARTSLEAAGIDVIDLLDSLGLDSDFLDDKITWTGCILFKGILVNSASKS